MPKQNRPQFPTTASSPTCSPARLAERTWARGICALSRDTRHRCRRPALPAGRRCPAERCNREEEEGSWGKHGFPQQKCTEPVAPSSGLPTDRRRSDCRSEGHQPRTLRTRCIGDSRGPWGRRQGNRIGTFRILRTFLLAQRQFAFERMCSSDVRGRRRPSPVGPSRNSEQKFAEPGTLSSTFPTGFPLPRTAARRASSYRRPVLGAGRNLRNRTCPIKGSLGRTSRKLRTSQRVMGRTSPSVDRD